MASPSASQLNVRPGTASAPKAKWLYRLRAPARWWSVSIVRTTVIELYRLVLRIREYSHVPLLRRGFPIATPDLSDCAGDVSCAENRFLRSCSEDMQHLRTVNRWAGNLDLRMAAQSYLLGAEAASRSFCSAKHNE